MIRRPWQPRPRRATGLIVAACTAAWLASLCLIVAAVTEWSAAREFSAAMAEHDRTRVTPAQIQEALSPPMVLTATWYGDRYHGRLTASGAHRQGNPRHWRFDKLALTAAHKTLPFGTRLQVAYQGRQVEVVVTDRGPFTAGRDLDLSAAAFRALAPLERGVVRVVVRRVES